MSFCHHLTTFYVTKTILTCYCRLAVFACFETFGFGSAGVAHLAVLNADFEKAPRHKHLSGEVSYTLTVESSLCLSWDDHRGAWTHHGCRTQRADATAAVSCR